MLACPQCRVIYRVRKTDFCGLDGARLIEIDDDPHLNTRLKSYQIEKRLGAGGTGSVYRAKCTLTGQIVALKILYGEMSADAAVVARFRREAEILSQLNHPNIVSMVDFGVSEAGLAFLATELIYGQTLEAMVQRESPLDAARVASLGKQIASALVTAHSAGFVHRDLKPSNIMIINLPDQEWLKVLDFGLATKGERTSEGDRLTSMQTLLGTPLYMAPEQFMSSTVGTAADLYSLGVILYEMQAGHPPFSGPDVGQAHVTHTPDPLPGKQNPLSDLTMCLLQKSPSARPSNALAVVRALDESPLNTTRPGEDRIESPDGEDPHETTHRLARPTAEQLFPTEETPQPSRRWGLGLALLVFFICAPLGLWLVSKGGEGETPVATKTEKQAPAYQPAPAQVAEVSFTTTEPAKAPEEARPPPKTPPKTPLKRAKRRKRIHRRPKPVPVKKRPPEPDRPGSLRLSFSGADKHQVSSVYVDGIKQDRPRQPISLSTGIHRVEVWTIQGVRYRRDVYIERNKQKELSFHLNKTPQKITQNPQEPAP